MTYGASIADALYTDTRLYVETILPTPIVIKTIKNGDVVMFAGARLRSSDFGDGALDLSTFLLNGACLNGMVRESQMRKIHLGAKLQDNLMLSQETYRKDNEASISAVQDITKFLYDPEQIKAKAFEINKACEVDVDFHSELKKLVGAGGLRKEETESVEKILMASNPNDGVTGEATLWKLTQAITAHARNINKDNPRRSRELQELSGEMIQKVVR